MRIGWGRASSPPGHQVDPEATTLAPAGAGRLVGVIGAGGSPGRTFISVNSALGLAQSGLSVCLVDADPRLGTVAAQLDLGEDRSLFYLAHESTLAPVDDDLVDRHLQHFGPLGVLTGRFEPARGGTVTAELLATVATLLRSRYRLVMVDLGPLDNPETAAMARLCQLLVWVVSPTPLGADRFDRTVTSALASQLRAKPALAVINGTGTGALGQTEEALLRRYGISAGASVPHHRLAGLQAEARHRPAVMGGPLSQSLRRVAKAVAQSTLQPAQLEAGRDPRAVDSASRSLLTGEAPS